MVSPWGFLPTSYPDSTSKRLKNKWEEEGAVGGRGGRERERERRGGEEERGGERGGEREEGDREGGEGREGERLNCITQGRREKERKRERENPVTRTNNNNANHRRIQRGQHQTSYSKRRTDTAILNTICGCRINRFMLPVLTRNSDNGTAYNSQRL